METIIKTKNLKLTADLQEFIEEKIGGLKKFTKIFQEKNGEFFVDIEKETQHHRKGYIFKAEGRVRLPGKTLVAISEKEDLRQAIIEVKEGLQQGIKKYKFKKTEAIIRKQRKNKNVNFK